MWIIEGRSVQPDPAHFLAARVLDVPRRGGGEGEGMAPEPGADKIGDEPECRDLYVKMRMDLDFLRSRRRRRHGGYSTDGAGYRTATRPTGRPTS